MSTIFGIRQSIVGLLLSSVLFLSGCASIPDSIKTTIIPEQDFVAVHNTPQQFVGQIARFGGKVVSVKNKEDGSYLEIAVVPLDSSAQPLFESASLGRLLAKSPGFLDPTDFNGQLITVVGTLTGSSKGKISEMPYTFVTMNITGYQRWKINQEILLPPQYIGPWYGNGFYDRWRPGYVNHWYNIVPARPHTFITESP